MKNFVLIFILALSVVLVACNDKPADKPTQKAAVATTESRDLMAPPIEAGTPMPADHPGMDQEMGQGMGQGMGMDQGHPGIPMTSPHDMTLGQPGSGQMQRATVISSIDVPQFTYLEVDQDGKTRWLASTTIAVKKGDTIDYIEDSTMNNFTSKTLNKTFDSLTFVNHAEVVK